MSNPSLPFKRAVLQVADTGPLESLVVMLRTVGIECLLPDDKLKGDLRRIGCDTVLDVSSLVRGMGYSEPMKLPTAGPGVMWDKDVLYVDVKGHRNGPKVWNRWPNLRNRTLWYRINGGKPEHVVNARGDHGDEINPPCPVLTPNQWYSRCLKCEGYGETNDGGIPGTCDRCNGEGKEKRSYTCWPPFVRFDEFKSRKRWTEYDGDDRFPRDPICLIHNLEGWGYGRLIDPVRRLGVKCHGAGSPDGLVNHRDVPNLLSLALCSVHLKSSDAPGYAIYESLAAGCPVVCTRRLIWRCRMEELLIPNETCLVFDRETHDPLSDEDVESCRSEITRHLEFLRNADRNRKIGEAGRERLREIAWSPKRESDVSSLASFLQRAFGG